jgi:hypothetical protein
MRRLVIYDAMQEYILLKDIDKRTIHHILYAEHFTKVPMILVYHADVNTPHYEWACLSHLIIEAEFKFPDVHYAIKYAIDSQGYTIYKFDSIEEMFTYHINNSKLNK